MITRCFAFLACGGLFAFGSRLDTRQTVQGVQNALGIGKDPSAFSQALSGGRQYYFPNIDADNHLITLQISGDLNTVLSVPANNHTIFTTQDRPNDTGFFKYGNNNYLITYAVNPSGAPSFLRVLQNRGSDLTKNWVDIGAIKNTSGTIPTGVYDSQAFNHTNGKKYILYSRNANTIVIAQLVNETTIQNPTAVIGTDHTTEAPGWLIQNKTLNIFWSENFFGNTSYNVRRLSVSTDADPTNSTTWKNLKVDTILASNNNSGVYGPGSASSFTGPDGKPWIAYDCFYTYPNLVGPRRVQAQPVVFNGDVMAVLAPAKPTRFVNSTTS